jgi:tetratricopeptide (TPR) repeat protein
MIRLSKTSTQQMIVMENLASLDGHIPGEQNPIVPGARQVQIVHELLLFNPGTGDLTVNKEIPAGNYSVEEILRGRHRWLVLKGEPWGNAASCWEAVQEVGQAQSAKRGFLHRITRAQQKIVIRVKSKSFRQSKADSLAAYKEAGRLIRQGDWAGALPLLQKASADDPDSYEIAYRLVQAAHQVGPRPDAADVLNKVMAQSRWTENEEQMLKQLKR